MAQPRHKHALDKPARSWKLPRRLVRVAAPVTAVAVLGGTAAAVTWPEAEQQSVSAISMPRSAPSAQEAPDLRVEPISRSAKRVTLKAKPVPEVTDRLFTTARLNVWTRPTESSKLLEVLDWAEKVAVTGRTKGPWTEIVQDKKSRWVNSAYLAEKKPKPEPEPEPEATEEEPAAAVGDAPCAYGSEVESGLVPNGVAVYRAVCNAFPQIQSYGGYRADDGAHGSGQGLDVMITDSATGDQIAEFVRANAGDLGVSEVIWAQKIWTVERSSEGWRYMEDRGSTTANHYDHVHVTVY